MESQLFDLLVNGGATGILIVAVIVLWRENRRLTAKIEEVLEIQKSIVSLSLNHGQALEKIDKKTALRINALQTNETGGMDGRP